MGRLDVGYVLVFEAVWNSERGWWHPHLHVLFLYRCSDGEYRQLSADGETVGAVFNLLERLWVKHAATYGLNAVAGMPRQHGRLVTSADDAAATTYLTKISGEDGPSKRVWTASDELARADLKRSRSGGLAARQLWLIGMVGPEYLCNVASVGHDHRSGGCAIVRAYYRKGGGHDQEPEISETALPSRAEAVQLWADWIEAHHGRHVIRYSKGLLARHDCVDLQKEVEHRRILDESLIVERGELKFTLPLVTIAPVEYGLLDINAPDLLAALEGTAREELAELTADDKEAVGEIAERFEEDLRRLCGEVVGYTAAEQAVTLRDLDEYGHNVLGSNTEDPFGGPVVARRAAVVVDPVEPDDAQRMLEAEYELLKIKAPGEVAALVDAARAALAADEVEAIGEIREIQRRLGEDLRRLYVEHVGTESPF